MEAGRLSIPREVHDLVRHSVRLGADLRLVQAAGGNLSAKADGVLWIKASGTRLSQAANRNIFVPMDEAATREAVLGTEQLMPFVLEARSHEGLRPSIETALHALLPHPVVFHVHGVGSIAAGLTEGVNHAAGSLPDWFDTVVVPYAKPGVQLARAVMAQLPPDQAGVRPLVLVLRNHGMVVGAPDCTTARQVLDLVEERFRSAGPPEVDLDAPGSRLCPPGTVDATARDVLCSGPLTPDSAVFLGPTPFGRSSQDGPPVVAPEHAASVAPDGSVWVSPATGADEREIIASLVDVARQVGDSRVSVLSPLQVDELVNWEAEKWRHELKR